MRKNSIILVLLTLGLSGCASVSCDKIYNLTEMLHQPDPNGPLLSIDVVHFCIKDNEDPLSKAHSILRKEKWCPGGYKIDEDSLSYTNNFVYVSYKVDCKKK